jgi:CheY-like chemotaxis protein
MRGEVDVQSEVGRGSTFVVRLPLDRMVVSLGTRPGALQELPAPALDGHVLVADDDDVTALLATTALENAGLRVTRVGGGEAAIARSIGAVERPDVVLMDCEMPGLDGLEATRQIRAYETRSGLPRLPIVAMTGHAGPEAVERTRSAGMDDHLTKPFGMQDLVRTVARQLGETNAAAATSRLRLKRMG